MQSQQKTSKMKAALVLLACTSSVLAAPLSSKSAALVQSQHHDEIADDGPDIKHPKLKNDKRMENLFVFPVNKFGKMHQAKPTPTKASNLLGATSGDGLQLGPIL